MSTTTKAAPPQTEQDHIERLRAMESDHGETWDLSPNDQAAIRWARHQIETIDEALARRPALAEFKHRYDKVYHACEMAGRADKAEAVNKELLEALEKLVGMGGAPEREWKPMAEKAQAAIAKARGR